MLKQGKPLYHIKRRVEESDFALFGDGAHILYVNGEYRNLDDPIGRLMHDFHCKNAEDMFSPILAERVNHFKGSEEGGNQMCRIMEDVYNDGMRKACIDIAVEMLSANKYSMEEIVRFTRLSMEEIEKLAKERFILYPNLNQ